jgi:hypothetical protein
MRDSGIVDQHVQTPPTAQRGFDSRDRFLDGSLVRHIELNDSHTIGGLSYGLKVGRRLANGDDDSGDLGSRKRYEMFGKCETQATGAARDEVCSHCRLGSTAEECGFAGRFAGRAKMRVVGDVFKNPIVDVQEQLFGPGT